MGAKQRTVAHDASRASRTSESGQVLVLVVLGILVLFGGAALGIDASRTFEERRAAQTAVDHAAVAAAFASCTGSNLADARTAGQTAASRNGFDDAASSIVVSISRLGSASSHAYQADITSTIPSTFARAIGINTFTVSVTAVASGTGCGVAGASGGPGTIYAGGTDCTGGKFSVDISGSEQEVYGGVHSNSDARVGGGSNDFTEVTDPDVPDPFTYTGSLAAGSIGNDNEYAATYPASVPSPSPQWPSGWAPSDASDASMLAAYQALAMANGTYFTDKITAITGNGVYYTSSTDGIDIGSVIPTVVDVVLVAPNGEIKVSVSNRTFNPYYDPALPREGILMISGKTYAGTERCDKYSIAVSGSTSTWNGVIWGPGGLVQMSGSGNSAVNGSLIGWGVQLNGSKLLVRYEGNPSAGASDPQILLLE